MLIEARLDEGEGPSAAVGELVVDSKMEASEAVDPECLRGVARGVEVEGERTEMREAVVERRGGVGVDAGVGREEECRRSESIAEGVRRWVFRGVVGGVGAAGGGSPTAEAGIEAAAVPVGPSSSSSSSASLLGGRLSTASYVVPTLGGCPLLPCLPNNSLGSLLFSTSLSLLLNPPSARTNSSTSLPNSSNLLSTTPNPSNSNPNLIPPCCSVSSNAKKRDN